MLASCYFPKKWDPRTIVDKKHNRTAYMMTAMMGRNTKAAYTRITYPGC